MTAPHPDQPLWRPHPEALSRTRLGEFLSDLPANIAPFQDLAPSRRVEAASEDYAALHRWSLAHKSEFWAAVWDHFGVIGDKGSAPWLEHGDAMPGARWFPRATLNFAENLLRGADERVALIETAEDGRRQAMTLGELRAAVARLADWLRLQGVQPGERVAAYLPNGAAALISMLATAAVGGIFSSCSPDFGLQGVIDRFGQIAPRVLIAANGYQYAGKCIDTRGKVAEILQQLGTDTPALIRVAYMDNQPWEDPPEVAADRLNASVIDWDALQAGPVPPLHFTPRGFADPLYILYSSGTTGAPKCIVHSVGGTLLQHLKELGLHTDLRPGERIFYYSTCGWMMWNWLVSALALEATVVLYDGSPFHPSPSHLFDIADRESIAVFGASARYYAACEKAGLQPRQTHRLNALRTLLSTGSPLAHESFLYLYRDVKSDVCVSSISGGTDILSCFALGNPLLPVHAGELQCAGLGMDVAFVDPHGHPLTQGKGELVCRSPFPSMPIGFWNDPAGQRFHKAYFARFAGIWAHGDFGELVPHAGHDGIIIHGRSDAVLNPGGVRIGTAEIYRQVEKIPAVLESLAIGQRHGSDERVVLFVRLREGLTLDAALESEIRRTIRDNTTPRHVPALICQVADIPRTLSGKIVELAVRQVVHGEPVENRHALANPEALDLFRHIAALHA